MNGRDVLGSITVAQLRDFDPELAQGVENTMRLSQEDFEGLLETEELPVTLTKGERAQGPRVGRPNALCYWILAGCGVLLRGAWTGGRGLRLCR